MTQYEQLVRLLAGVVRRVSEDSGVLGGGPDVARAVSELVTALDAEAKVVLIEQNPLLRSDQAEWLVSRVVEYVRANTSAEAFADGRIGKYLQNVLGVMQFVRDGELTVEETRRIKRQYPSPDALPAEDDSPRVLEQRGRWLLDAGRLDAAEAALYRAVMAARAVGEPEVEGDAEIALFKVWMETTHSADEAWTRMIAHARRAEAAYRTADDARGVQNALVAQITVMVDQKHWTEGEEVLDRLEAHSEPVARWWRRYASAMGARDIETMLDGLRWCRDSADLLDEQATFYGQMCDGKVAALEARPTDVGPHMTPNLAALTALSLTDTQVDADGDAVIKRGEDLVRAAEKLRRRTRTQRVQRRLSDTYALTYVLHASNVERLSGSEQAVDVLEAATSRALLAQLWAHELWADAVEQPWARTDPRPTPLERVLGRFLTDPSPGNRSLLMAAFGRALQVREREELTQLLDGRRAMEVISGPLPTVGLRSLLGDDEAVVVYGGTGAVYVITRGRCERVATFKPGEISDLVTVVLPTLAKAGPPTPDLRRLAERVIDPLREHLPTGTQVYMVPHGDLWQLPLGHIGDEPLADSRAVSYVPSLTLLGHLLTAPRLDRMISRFVGFGDPDGSLPHARRELRQAAEVFGDVMIRTGDELEFNPVVANMADADILHLACHGLFFPEHPDFSALHLGGPLQQPQVLWYGDLARLRLNARLVVLASCHAGTGRVLPGPEYIGFPGVFLAAGARAVLAPLWAVDDQVTATLMEHFYPALAECGSTADALRTAQHQLRSDPATAHPRHWAGFQIFGMP